MRKASGLVQEQPRPNGPTRAVKSSATRRHTVTALPRQPAPGLVYHRHRPSGFIQSRHHSDSLWHIRRTTGIAVPSNCSRRSTKASRHVTRPRTKSFLVRDYETHPIACRHAAGKAPRLSPRTSDRPGFRAARERSRPVMLCGSGAFAILIDAGFVKTRLGSADNPTTAEDIQP